MKICSAGLLATGCRCEFSACTVTLIVFTMQNSCNSMWEWKALIFVELNDLYKFYFWIALETWNCDIIKKAIQMSFQSFIFWLWCICHWGFHRTFSFPDGLVYISKARDAVCYCVELESQLQVTPNEGTPRKWKIPSISVVSPAE